MAGQAGRTAEVAGKPAICVCGGPLLVSTVALGCVVTPWMIPTFYGLASDGVQDAAKNVKKSVKDFRERRAGAKHAGTEAQNAGPGAQTAGYGSPLQGSPASQEVALGHPAPVEERPVSGGAVQRPNRKTLHDRFGSPGRRVSGADSLARTLLSEPGRSL